LLFSLLVLIYICEKDDNLITKEGYLKTVALADAKSFLRQSQDEKNSTPEGNFITSISDEINYEDLTNTDQHLAVIPVTTQYSKLNSRLVLFTINDEIQSAIVSLNPYENSTSNSFSGEMLITDTKGNFVKGFRIEKNVLVSEYFNDKKAGKTYTDDIYTMSKLTVDCDTCTFLECSYCDIGEVDLGVIERDPPPAPYIFITHMYPAGGGRDETSTNEWDLGGSGPGYTNNTPEPEDCPEGFTRDISGECLEANPCDKINNQITNSAFLDKIEELESKTDQTKETGYVENTSGTFTELDPVNGGHSLSLAGVDKSRINGFIHTHLDDFPTGRYDENTGAPEMNEIYRMFSPADVIAFLDIARLSSNTDNVYATVITSTGRYTLRFTGNPSDIVGLNSANSYKADYIEYMDRYSNLERGFLNFLRDQINIDGIELYKITKPLFSADYKIKSKNLDRNGRIQTEDCE
jgi:hypothetical protein